MIYLLKALFLCLFLPLSFASSSTEDIEAYNRIIGMSLADAMVAKPSPFGTLYVFESKPYRAFAIDDLEYLQSAVNMADPTELPFEYARVFMLGLLYPEQVRDVMVIGLGGGQTSMYLGKYMPRLRIVSVDINPVVLEIAEKYMGYKQSAWQRAVIADALDVLRDPTAFHVPVHYDIIMMDAFSAADVPPQLQGVAFWQLLKSRLTKDGVLVQNVIHRPQQMMRELWKVFDNVDFYDGYSDEQLVAIAYDGPKKDLDTLMQRAIASQKRFNWRYAMPRLLESTVQLRGAQKKMISDAALEAHNPQQGLPNS